MQVAKEHMPMSSLIVGVDLVPIKPIPGCIAIQGDITTEKCRSDLRKELQNWKADLVLNDGAPNVGKNWLHDAYQQSLLTLHAFKLASEFLTKGGTFVTKVFRSKDYQSLLWVFNQFFKNVHATKPSASRNESAEIFVVCQNYKNPDKIDPKFLDPKHVFSEVDEEAAKEYSFLMNPEKRKKAPAEGYETGQVSLLYRKTKASEFIMGDKPIHVLENCHEILIDEVRIKKHPKTSQEIVECCKDVQILGIKELKLLKKWREVLRVDFEKIDKEKAELDLKQGKTVDDVSNDQVNDDSDADSDESEDLNKLDKEIETLKDEERKTDRRKKKRSLKEKRKIAQKIDLKMIIPGDEGPVREEEGLFQMADLKTKKDLDRAIDQAPEQVVPDSDSDGDESKPKVQKYSKENKNLDENELIYKEKSASGSDAATSSSDDEDEDDDSGKEDLELEEDEEENGDVEEEVIDDLNEASNNPLLVSLEEDNTKLTRKKRKANLWFDKDIFQGIDDDEDLEESDIHGAIKEIKKKGGHVLSKEVTTTKKPPKKKLREYHSDSEEDDLSENNVKKVDADNDDSDSDSSDDEEKEVQLNKKQRKKKQKRIILTPEELALGQEMIKSKKTRRDIIDSGWNRFMFNDKDSDLPDWFVKEEEHHMRLPPDVDPNVVEFYKNRQKDVNVKTIKKVVEAKARKKRLLTKRMEKAKKRASVILENADLGTREKANEIKKMYKKAASTMKKPEVKYVVAKKHSAAARAKRPAGKSYRKEFLSGRIK